MGAKAERIKYELWLQEREKLLRRPALQGAYHVNELLRLGEAPRLSDVLKLEKYDLDSSGDDFNTFEIPTDPQRLDNMHPSGRGVFNANVFHPRYEPCYRGNPHERTVDGGLPDPLDPHRRFPCNEEGTFIQGRTWTI